MNKDHDDKINTTSVVLPKLKIPPFKKKDAPPKDDDTNISEVTPPPAIPPTALKKVKKAMTKFFGQPPLKNRPTALDVIDFIKFLLQFNEY